MLASSSDSSARSSALTGHLIRFTMALAVVAVASVAAIISTSMPMNSSVPTASMGGPATDLSRKRT